MQLTLTRDQHVTNTQSTTRLSTDVGRCHRAPPPPPPPMRHPPRRSRKHQERTFGRAACRRAVRRTARRRVCSCVGMWALCDGANRANRANQRGIAHANRACESRESQGITRRGITANRAGNRAGIKGKHPDPPRFITIHAIRICDSGGSRDSCDSAPEHWCHRQPSRRARGSFHEIHQSRARRVPVNETLQVIEP